MSVFLPGGVVPRSSPYGIREDLRTMRRGLGVQTRVIGAIMVRELHTRFGRSNLGYLWLIVEPLILSLGISATHLFTHIDLPFGFTPGSFYASGYIAYIAFRNNVNRSSAAIEANKALLYHRQVTVTDIVLARSLLEFVAVLGAQLVVLSAFALLGLAEWPERPWYVLSGMAFLGWLSTGVGLIIAGANEMSPLVERFVHPTTYLMGPLSGMFYVLEMLPPDFARIISWSAIPQMTDIVRQGLLASYTSPYVNYPYLILVCSVATLFGLLLIRIARRRMHFD